MTSEEEERRWFFSSEVNVMGEAVPVAGYEDLIVWQKGITLVKQVYYN